MRSHPPFSLRPDEIAPSLLPSPRCDRTLPTAITQMRSHLPYCLHPDAIAPSLLPSPRCDRTFPTAITQTRSHLPYCLHPDAIAPSLLPSPRCDRTFPTAFTQMRSHLLYCLHPCDRTHSKPLEHGEIASFLMLLARCDRSSPSPHHCTLTTVRCTLPNPLTHIGRTD